jgi:hypothetical protein
MERVVAALAGALLALAAVPLLAGAQGGPKSSDLTIKAAPNPVVCCQAVKISGKFRGKSKEGRTVTLEHDPFPFDSRFSTVATTTTSKNGDYSFTRTPTQNIQYRTKIGSTFSPKLIEFVRPKVTLRVSDTTPMRGTRVRFRGKVRPAHDGKRVRIQRKKRGGGWSTLSRPRLREATGDRSRYRKRVRIRRDGTYRVRFPSDGDHASGTSREVAIDAHG